MRIKVVLAAAVLLVAASVADARITKIKIITKESPTFGGYTFAGVGQYEKLVGEGVRRTGRLGSGPGCPRRAPASASWWQVLQRAGEQRLALVDVGALVLVASRGPKGDTKAAASSTRAATSRTGRDVDGLPTGRESYPRPRG